MRIKKVKRKMEREKGKTSRKKHQEPLTLGLCGMLPGIIEKVN
jgi:hypothetical protein